MNTDQLIAKLDELIAVMTISVNIKACHQCPHYTNSSREHNDPFTSEPFPVRHYCEHGKSRMISGEGIDADCPLKDGSK